MQTGSEVRKVVINSSPVISLSIIGKMELLRELFQEVYIPRAVYNEIVNKGEKQTGRRELQNADWIQIKDVRNINLKESIKIELDEGEAEVITLAKENDIQTVIIDEFAGRQYAVLMGLNVIGTLGILLAAKKMHKIQQIKPLLDILIKRKRFISKELYLSIIKAADEME